MDSNKLIKNILKDVKVELDDEFDRNFERKAFFDHPWAPLSKNYNPPGGSMLMRTGALRKSLRSGIDGNTLVYESSLRYASLMNDGGTVRQDFVPSSKMRRWAWAQFRQSKDEKFRRMALAKRIRRTFTVPARPFIGDHPAVRSAIDEITGEYIRKEAEQDIKLILNTKR